MAAHPVRDNGQQAVAQQGGILLRNAQSGFTRILNGPSNEDYILIPLAHGSRFRSSVQNKLHHG